MIRILLTTTLLILTQQTSAQDDSDEMGQLEMYARDCALEQNIANEVLEKIDSIEEWSELSKDQQCFMKCIIEKYEILDENGELIEENLDDFQLDFFEDYFEIDEKYIQCLKDATPVVECEDIIEFLECDDV